MTLAVAMTAMMVMIVLRRPLMVFSKTMNISLKRADWALPLMKAANKMRIPGVLTQTKV